MHTVIVGKMPKFELRAGKVLIIRKATKIILLPEMARDIAWALLDEVTAYCAT